MKTPEIIIKKKYDFQLQGILLMHQTKKFDLRFKSYDYLSN